eukprot:gnl/Hemi2/21836_TR7291_c0_g1_i1.p1 gnl/Hemi2/21836_TR7291_c0_g1~~gnl/Hemi2/21836_TR7291_c0_g1_i1.p1  ORF type:complete len:164 (-),score=41.97 gnl/Hemi2/21836_TR7291_c0_g1_i1:83-574(-)
MLQASSSKSEDAAAVASVSPQNPLGISLESTAQAQDRVLQAVLQAIASQALQRQWEFLAFARSSDPKIVLLPTLNAAGAKHLDSATTQALICEVVVTLAPFGLSIPDVLRKAGVAATVVAALTRHPADPQVALHGCLALGCMMNIKASYMAVMQLSADSLWPF